MSLKVYNSLSGKLEEFVPFKKGKVGMYVCGPTVYDWTHVGHARTYVDFDIIIHWLKYRGFSVTYIQNITDVGHLREDTGEDKIGKKSAEEKVHPMMLVEKYMREYFRDMDRLEVTRPDISPRATGHICEIIEAVKKLIEKGYAYEVNGNVFFDVSKFKKYGKLSKINPEEMTAGTRFEVHPDKRNPEDFALWKKAKQGDPFKWQSPWGEGFPGWHIECSVMSTKYLGDQVDVHGGARDLKFPHHENEIAQAEAITGKKPFVKYWLHTEFLTINGEKMAKSLGNYVTVRQALEKYDAETLRFFFASTHYRSQIDYSDKNLEQARRSLESLKNSVALLKKLKPSKEKSKEELEEDLKKAREEFEKAMDDDFNTPGALAALFEFSKKLNVFASQNDSIRAELKEKILKMFEELGGILGLKLGEEKRAGGEKLEKVIELLIKAREELRKKGDWKASDEIRARLKEAGIVLNDEKEGTSWKFE
jgi:cysteinyl-tRNA synthetase